MTYGINLPDLKELRRKQLERRAALLNSDCISMRQYRCDVLNEHAFSGIPPKCIHCGRLEMNVP